MCLRQDKTEIGGKTEKETDREVGEATVKTVRGRRREGSNRDGDQ